MAMIGLAHHKWGDGPDLIYGEIPIEETEANTRLIVTAVNCHYELLEGLKMLLESYDASGPCDCGGSSLCAICNAQKIIAKVEAMEK